MAEAEPPLEPAPPARLEEALRWRGAKLDELGGGAVGRVEGVYVDSEDGAPRWLAVRMGRFGHFSALPFENAAGAAGRVWVPYERRQIREAPRIEVDDPLTRELELELCAYFGIPEDSGRAAELSARPAGSATSRPAANA